MHALVLREHGGLDKLVFEARYPDPSPGAGDVLLSMRACSLNYHDVFTRKGMPGIKVPLPLITGIDVTGDIVDVGPGVTGLSPGDRVLVDPIDRVEERSCSARPWTVASRSSSASRPTCW